MLAMTKAQFLKHNLPVHGLERGKAQTDTQKISSMMRGSAMNGNLLSAKGMHMPVLVKSRVMLEYCGTTILEALGPTWPARCFGVSLNNENAISC